MTRNDREISFDRNFLRLDNIQELDIKTEMKKCLNDESQSYNESNERLEI